MNDSVNDYLEIDEINKSKLFVEERFIQEPPPELDPELDQDPESDQDNEENSEEENSEESSSDQDDQEDDEQDQDQKEQDSGDGDQDDQENDQENKQGSEENDSKENDSNDDDSGDNDPDEQDNDSQVEAMEGAQYDQNDLGDDPAPVSSFPAMNPSIEAGITFIPPSPRALFGCYQSIENLGIDESASKEELRKMIHEMHDDHLNRMNVNDSYEFDSFEEFIYCILHEYQYPSYAGNDQMFLVSQFLTAQEFKKLLGFDYYSKNPPTEFLRNYKEYPEDKSFALNLRNITRDNKYDRKISSRKDGTLDGNQLYKVSTKNYKVFEKKVARKNKEYRFSIILDQSGSMSNGFYGERPIDQASDLVVCLAKAFDFADVSYSCYGYSSHSALYKQFDKKINYKLLKTMLCNAMWDNNEIPALFDCYKKFPKANKNNNFIIFISDGGIRPSQYRAMEKLIKKNNKVATFIGIGVGPKRNDLNFSDIEIQKDTIAEVKLELLKVIRKSIHRG